MISIKTPQEIEIMRQGGRLLARILQELIDQVVPGVSTEALDEYANRRMLEVGGEPAFLGYKNDPDDSPYPSTLCVSINSEVVHAPARPGCIINSGDIVSVDIGIRYPAQKGDGKRPMITDMARTVSVGVVPERARSLIAVTQRALSKAIDVVREGATTRDIARAVESIVYPYGFGIVRSYVGHGVGYYLHEDPQIPHYVDRRFPVVTLMAGMCICIEPMIVMGEAEVETGDDGWTVKTVDGSLAAHVEHTLVVTKEGCEVVTRIE